MPLPSGIQGYLAAEQSERQRQGQNLERTVGVMGLLRQLQQQQETEQLKGALARGDKEALARLPGGIGVLGQLAQLEETQRVAGERKKLADFNARLAGPEFGTLGTPEISLPPDIAGPVQPAQPGQFDLRKALQAKVQAGLLDPLAYQKELDAMGKPVAIGRGGLAVRDENAPGGFRQVMPGAAEKPNYKERTVSYDGKTYTKEVSRDNGVTWEKVPGSIPVDIRKATGGTDIKIDMGGSGEANVPGIGMQDKRELAKQVRQSAAAIADLTRFIANVKKTPGAIGLKGTVGVPVSGVAEQFLGQGTGETVSKAITGGSQASVREIRTQAQLLRGRLLPIATGESGRFTESERAMAGEAMAALDATQGPSQVFQASKTILQLELLAQSRAQRALGVKNRFDLSKPEGGIKQGRELKAMGFSDEETLKILRELKNAWGQ